jgi:hypothetical protein
MVMAERQGEAKGKTIQVMARNNPPSIPCDICGKESTQLCAECLYEDEGRYCEEHAEEHEHDDMLLPVVNSPRVGECGYTG